MSADAGFYVLPAQGLSRRGRTAENVLEITVGAARTGESRLQGAKTTITRAPSASQGRSSVNRTGVMHAVLGRVLPLGGLAIALIVTVAWIGVLGYAVSKLF